MAVDGEIERCYRSEYRRLVGVVAVVTGSTGLAEARDRPTRSGPERRLWDARVAGRNRRPGPPTAGRRGPLLPARHGRCLGRGGARYLLGNRQERARPGPGPTGCAAR